MTQASEVSPVTLDTPLPPGPGFAVDLQVPKFPPEARATMD